MTIIAGVVGRRSAADLRQLCTEMFSCVPLGRGAPSIAAADTAAFGQWFIPKLDIDGTAAGGEPVLSPSGRFLLTGDVRLDEWPDGERQLAARDRSGGDLARLALFWDRHGPAACRRLVGDILAAVWDLEERQLTLVRSISANRPLLFVERKGLLAFGSMLQSLSALGAAARLDLAGLATALAGDSYLGGQTMFTGVRLVRPGTMVHLRGGAERVEDLWEGLTGNLRYSSLQQSAEALRSATAQAVHDRMRRAGGLVASQLSAGRDSSAVTALAATDSAQRGEPLVAVTGAPALGTRYLAADARLRDESALASLTAARHSNIRHLVCRAPADLCLADELDDAHRSHFGPLLNAGSIGWWNATIDGARGAGARVLLTGTAGNMTISAGGGLHLFDALEALGLGAGLRQVSQLVRGSPATRRNLLRLGVGALLPPAAYLRVQRLRSGAPDAVSSLFRAPLRELMQAADASSARRWTPRRNGYGFRLAALKAIEPAQPLFRHGKLIDVRDPTIDARVVRTCFAMAPQWLLSRVDERPLYRAAFGDLLPDEVAGNPIRGHQGADWYRHFSRRNVTTALERYRASAAVRELVDLAAIEQLVGAWPDSGPDEPPGIAAHRQELGLALSLASFLFVSRL